MKTFCFLSPIKKFVFLFIFLGLFSFLNLPKAAAAISVDGNLSDWGVTPGVFGNSDWVPNAGVYFTEEDTSADQHYVGPGWGGQIFDAEALYAKREGNTLYIALVTGFPFTGVEDVQFGDFAFDFGSNGSYEFGLETRGNDGFIKGSLYGNATWLDPAIVGSTPFDLKTGDLLGVTDYAQGQINLPVDTHYIVEAGIPLGLFGSLWDESGNPDFTLHWTMGCGNDVLEVHVPETPRTAVPEPGTLALMTMGLGSLAFFKKKKKNA